MIRISAICCIGLSWVVGPVTADVIRLEHGGEIRGEVTNDTMGDEAPLMIHTLAGAKIEVARKGIEFVKRRSRVIEEYVTESRRVPHTIEGHWGLAEWCRTRNLDAQRAEQLELLLEIDPNHADARRLLGHVQHNGRWMPRDEMMTARGYIKHKRRWITRQEHDLTAKNDSEREAEIAWYPKIRLWFGWVRGSDARRRRDGVEKFATITDEDAVSALVQFMSDYEVADTRLLFVKTLGKIPGRKAVKPLLDRYLFDRSESVRNAAWEALRPEQYLTALPALITALQHQSNDVVRRSARGLEQIGDERAIPHLIASLVTTHKFRIQVPTGNAMTFGRTADGRTGMVNSQSPSAFLPPEIEAMARAGQLPYGVTVTPYLPTTRLTKTVMVKTDVKNQEVLAALKTLTGQNLGYNERDWQLWWSIQQG